MSDTILVGRITQAPKTARFLHLQDKNEVIPLAIRVNFKESTGVTEGTPKVLLLEVLPMSTPTYVEFLSNKATLRTYQIIGPGRSGEQNYDVAAELTLEMRSYLRRPKAPEKRSGLGNVILTCRADLEHTTAMR